MALLSACVGAGRAGPGVPESVAGAFGGSQAGVASEVGTAALAAERSTRPARPTRLVFRWRAREPDFRGSGMGVARVEPPYRARLDLFLDNGETAATAALVDDELRIPPSLPTELVPPPPLLWAALGVFRPGSGAVMLHGAIERGTMAVAYRLPAGERVRFTLRDGALLDAELLERGSGSAVARVFVEGGDGQSTHPREATYRNLPDYRELQLELESVEHVDPFPPDIWTPHGP